MSSTGESKRTDLRLAVESACDLGDYGRIPIAFEVTDRLDLTSESPAVVQLQFRTHTVEPNFTKDYDRILGNSPAEWAHFFAVDKWRFTAAFFDAHRVASAALILDPTKIGAEVARNHLAILWDIRVDPSVRRQGIGRRLLHFAESYVRSQGLAGIKVETQDINVPACRFYHNAGYTLTEINRSAYPALPNEAQLVWHKTFPEHLV